MFKGLLLGCVALQFLFSVFQAYLDKKQQKLPLPKSVCDIYDAAAYKKWSAYNQEQRTLSLISDGVSFAVIFLMFACNGFAALSRLLPQGQYANSLLLLGAWLVISSVLSLPFDYYGQMKIEEKYGFNRTTKKTFFIDQVKNLLLSLLLILGLAAVCIACYNAFGLRFFVVVYAVLAGFMLLLSTFSLTLQKLFNKFTPLEEGTLRTRLEALFTSNGYQLKNIYVMDASKRTAKVNAFCTGLGKFKEIALYDNLVNNYSEDEILAVFSHELTHFKHSDTRHLTLMQLLLYLPLVLLLWVMTALPGCMTALGFEGLHFGVILLTAFMGFFPLIMLVCMIPISAFSRHCEYRADAYAAELGLGEAMISTLKKLSRDNFANLNPHPLNVKLSYSHPTTAERIEAIRRKK